MGVCLCVCVCVYVLSHVRLFAVLWNVACQAPLFMGFLRQEHWGELPLPSPGDLPIQGLNPCLLHGQVDSLPLTRQGNP